MKRVICRLAIEFQSPLLIASGKGDHRADQVFVADANGLPSIPGTSLAGALRESYEQFRSATREELAGVEELFGTQAAGDATPSSKGSAIRISWGYIHDFRNQPVEGLRPASEIAADPVLRQARDGVHRHHVRISHRGVAEGRAKFDVEQVAAGHRFSFELSLDYEDGNEGIRLKKAFDAVVGLLASGQVALGSGRGTGLGRFHPVRLHGQTFELPRDLVRLSELEHGIGAVRDLSAMPIPAHRGHPLVLRVELPLKARGPWFVGAGEPDPEDPTRADMVPARESRIEWNGDTGKVVSRRLVVAGSALRGPLRHRVAFHFNRSSMNSADGLSPAELEALTGERNGAAKILFGRIADTRQGKEPGQRGLVRVEDVYVDESKGSQAPLPHVSLDRFTGGPVDGLLFTENARVGDRLDVSIEIDLRRQALDGRLRESLSAALKDLAEGRLQIGAGSGRGNGFFSLVDPDSMEWPEQLGPRPAPEKAVAE